MNKLFDHLILGNHVYCKNIKSHENPDKNVIIWHNYRKYFFGGVILPHPDLIQVKTIFCGPFGQNLGSKNCLFLIVKF